MQSTATLTQSQEHSRQFTRKAIGMAVKNNRPQVIALLKKYGISSSNNYTDNEIIVGILVANRSMPRFRADLKALLMQTTPAAASNFTGKENFFFTGEEGMKFFYFTAEKGGDPAFFNFSEGDTRVSNGSTEYYYQGTWVDGDSWDRIQNGTQNTMLSSPSTSSSSTGKTAIGSYLSNNLGTILNTGLSTLSTVITNKSNSKLADQALQIETEKTKQAALLAGSAGAAAAGAKPPMSTGAKIAIGVGVVAVIGVVVYLVAFRKKK